MTKRVFLFFFFYFLSETKVDFREEKEVRKWVFFLSTFCSLWLFSCLGLYKNRVEKKRESAFSVFLLDLIRGSPNVRGRQNQNMNVDYFLKL